MPLLKPSSRRKSSTRPQTHLRVESLETRRLLAADPASIHGTKWDDLNGDGDRDADEPGLAGVTIYSDLNHNGQIDRGEPRAVSMRDLPDTDFDEGGLYWLAGLTEGVHIIREVVPHGFVQTFPPQLIVDAFDVNDEVRDRGRFHRVKLEAGEVKENIDFGNHKRLPGSIHGTKWLDANGNAERDANEPGVAGVTIYLDLNFNHEFDRGEPATKTMRDDPQTDFDESGMYWLEDVRPGSYNVREVVPDGSIQTFPQLILFDALPPIPELPNGASHHVIVGSGQSVEGIDFGNMRARPGSVHGTKWLDVNADGIRNDSETGLAGIVIYSDLNFNGSLDRGEPSTRTMRDDPSTRVNETGHYWLKDLRPGFHSIREVVPDGLVQTFPGSLIRPVALDAADVEPFPIGGHHFVFVASGATVEGLDFGNFRFRDRAKVSGTKWLDRNGNGQRENNEPGVPGITIYSDLNFNGALDAGEPRVVTAEDNPRTAANEAGAYSLNRLQPGRHHLISEMLPDGFERTFPPPRDILAPWPISEPYFFFLAPGDSLEDIDFGNHPIDVEPGAVSGVKWHDTNGNGERDRGEKGVGGIRIFSDLNLNGKFDRHEPFDVTMNDNPLTALNEAGLYAFKLPPGKHLILETLPDQMEQTFPDPSRRLAFPFNLGHTIEVRSGRLVDGIDFGNRRIPPNGSIHGLKWLDNDENGRRNRNEPGLPGVTIYLDLNNNGTLDRGEPSTKSAKDNPRTDFDESGQYSFSGLHSRTYVVREVQPEGFAQSFPYDVHIEGTSTHNPPFGEAIGFDLIDAAQASNALGSQGIELTYEVVWPDSCGTLLPDRTNFTVKDQIIEVNMFGTQRGQVCADVVTTETQAMNVGNLIPRGYGIEATLFETRTNGDIVAIGESFQSTAKIAVIREGSHTIRLAPGQHKRNVNFGNHRMGVLGDFDRNGVVNARDIDLLGRATRAGSDNIFFDLNHDGMLNQADRDVMIHEVLDTVYGNANLDRVFDSSDLIKVFVAGEYEDDIVGNSNWMEGDWDGDGDFTTKDLIFAFRDGGYENGDAAVAAAIEHLWLEADRNTKKKSSLR